MFGTVHIDGVSVEQRREAVNALFARSMLAVHLLFFHILGKRLMLDLRL